MDRVPETAVMSRFDRYGVVEIINDGGKMIRTKVEDIRGEYCTEYVLFVDEDDLDIWIRGDIDSRSTFTMNFNLNLYRINI